MKYEVIESKVWRHDDGRTASIYGAVPFHSERERKFWQVETRGWTVRNTKTGVVGVSLPPWKTREEALEWAIKNS